MLVADATKMATKRKHHEVTLKVKYEALKELEKGRPNKGVANQFSIPGSTLATWKNNKEKIFEAFQNSSLKRQRVKTGTYEKLNEALLKWFTSMRGNNIPINGPILLEKAHEFAKAFNYNDFTASGYGCSNRCSSLACTVLYILKTHPLVISFKICPK